MISEDAPSVARTMGALLTLVTHDLRNPLSVLLTNIGYLDSVLVQGDIAEARTVLADLSVACDALARYLSNLDAMGASLSSRPLVVGRASAEAVVRSAVQAVQLPFEQQALAAEIHVAEGCPDLLVDAELATRGIENLLANCAVFAPRGSTVVVEVGPVGSERVRITVSDEGTPLPPEHRTLAFLSEGQELLQREASSRYGRGLGLLIAGVVARRLGGAVDTPPVAAGCKFQLDLPATPPDSPVRPQR